jgi:hypothetical protein
VKSFVYRDARNLSVRQVDEVLRREESSSRGVALTAWQCAALDGRLIHAMSERLLVTIPDFLNYGRMINTGQAVSLLKLSGSLPRAAISGVRSLPALLKNPIRAAKMDFWAFAEAMMRFDAALLPRGYSGPVLLHSYLADFAFLFEQRTFLEAFFRCCRAYSAGIHTQQPATALSCLARWGLSPGHFAYLFSPHDGGTRQLITMAGETDIFRDTRYIAEIESLPDELQRQIVHESEDLLSTEVSERENLC